MGPMSFYFLPGHLARISKPGRVGTKTGQRGSIILALAAQEWMRNGGREVVAEDESRYEGVSFFRVEDFESLGCPRRLG